MKENLTAIDLFCGCGGISCGLKMAGFEILAGADVEPKYMITFSHNFPKTKSLKIDLSKECPEDFMRLVGIKRGELFLVSGGPPCQGFSKNVPRKFRYLDDPNNLLIRTFLDYCISLKPRLVLMENVAEMKNGFDQKYTDEIVASLESEGYTVTYAVLNAADYGVPQRRRRAFFLGNSDGIKFDIPSPSHIAPNGQESLFGLPGHVTVWEAIGDLPSLKHGEGYDLCEYGSSPFSDYQRNMRMGQIKVPNHITRRLRPLQYERLSSLKPGQTHKDLPNHLKVNGGYSGAYGRLTKEMVAPTITRWVFHPGSGRWGHPIDIRLLSIREIARIQGFPDNFEFLGTYNQQTAQLGNAVPPLLIKRIVEDMLVQLGISNRERSSINLSREILSRSVGKRKAMV